MHSHLVTRLRFALDSRIRFAKKACCSFTSSLDAKGGHIWVGEKTKIHDYALLRAYGGDIRIGKHCSINPFCVLYGLGGLTIGDYVRIAAHTVIVPANHIFADIDQPIFQQGETKKGVTIEDDVWIGAGVRILDGVTLGKGAVIAAGAVVTKSVPAYEVWAGVPARKMRDRGESALNFCPGVEGAAA